MASGTPTAGLKLHIMTNGDDLDYNEVNENNQSIDAKVRPIAVTTATRPVGTERFDGRVVYDTDIAKYIKWIAASNQWRSVDFGANDSNDGGMTTAIANGSGVTVDGVDFTHKNGIAQIYVTWHRTTSIPDGDIGNFNVALIPDPWKPKIATVLSSGATGPASSYYLSTGGQVTLNGTSDAVVANGPMSFGGTYILT